MPNLILRSAKPIQANPGSICLISRRVLTLRTSHQSISNFANMHFRPLSIFHFSTSKHESIIFGIETIIFRNFCQGFEELWQHGPGPQIRRCIKFCSTCTYPEICANNKRPKFSENCSKMDAENPKMKGVSPCKNILEVTMKY